MVFLYISRLFFTQRPHRIPGALGNDKRVAEVSKGCNVPSTEKKVFSAVYSGHLYTPFPPINFSVPVAIRVKKGTDGEMF